MAGIKIQSGISKCFQCFPSFFYKSPAVQSISIHNCHMGEHRSVFFFSVCKSKHTSHIKLKLMKISIQAVTSNFLPIEIVVGALCDFFNLVVFRNSAHDSEDLAGQHHAYTIPKKSFNGMSVIIVIAVKPALLAWAVNPFMHS